MLAAVTGDARGGTVTIPPRPAVWVVYAFHPPEGEGIPTVDDPDCICGSLTRAMYEARVRASRLAPEPEQGWTIVRHEGGRPELYRLEVTSTFWFFIRRYDRLDWPSSVPDAHPRPEVES